MPTKSYKKKTKRSRSKRNRTITKKNLSNKKQSNKKQSNKNQSNKKRTLKKRNNKKRTLKKTVKKYTIFYHVAYKHMSSEKEPQANVLENYIKKSKYIPENINYLNLGDYIKEPYYVKNNTFSFTIKNSILSVKEIADTILNQSFADGEWGALPGDGSFVYPDSNKNELGLLYYDYLTINGKKFTKKLI